MFDQNLTIFRNKLGTDHLSWMGGGGGGGVMVFCFVGFLLRSEFFFRTTQELEFFLFFFAKHEIFFQNLTLGYMTKNLNHIIFFFLHQNQNIFFSNIGNQNIFLDKNHTPPFKLNGRSLIYLKIMCYMGNFYDNRFISKENVFKLYDNQ